MRTTTNTMRRGLCGVFAGCAIGGVAAAGLLTPAATAAPDPCAASQIAKTVGSVATSMGGYLDSHPQTNQALTTIAQQPAGPQSLGATKAYFDANPQAGKDMQQLQQPLVSLSTQCKLPITLPQLLGLMQAAQNPAGALPGGLPAGLPSAQTVSVPGVSAATSPAVSSPVSASTAGTGPLPGPAAPPAR